MSTVKIFEIGDTDHWTGGEDFIHTLFSQNFRGGFTIKKKNAIALQEQNRMSNGRGQMTLTLP